MKKINVIWLLVLCLCCCMLSGCDNDRGLYGKVLSPAGEHNGDVYYILRTSDGEDFALLLTDDTRITCFAEGIDAQSFREGRLTGVSLWAYYNKAHKKQITHNGSEMTAYIANDTDIMGYLRQDKATLSDGTEINIWQYPDGIKYALDDGTELLNVNTPSGPADTYTADIETIGDLGEAAAAAIMEYYTEQGVLYDEMAELERAYAAYAKAQQPSDFGSPRHINQSTSPSASNSDIMYFFTSVLLPEEDNYGYELRLGAAFDKATGQHINSFDLFDCSPDDALDRMIDISAGDIDPALRQEMHNAFKPECIIFFPEGLEVSFSKGTLPSQEYGYGLTLDYDERLLELLHPWAVPFSNDK